MKGLTFSCPEGPQFYQVFDTHARKRYNIPSQPKPVEIHSCALGMTVDTSGFKIILGSRDFGTQIYDSVTKSWETRSSHLVPCNLQRMYGLMTCLHCGDYIYIWAQLDKILTYSLKEDKWDTLDPPPRNPSDSNWRGLGSWEGRLFTVNCDGDATLGAWTNDDEDDSCIAPLLWVWEKLVDQGWKKVDEMPGDMQRWLTPLRIHDYKDIEIHARFSDEHVLMYSWVPEAARAFRFVLYNVATKMWEKVEVPNHSVSILPDDERDSERWDLEDMYSMQLEDAFQEAQEMGQGDLFAQGLLHCLTGGFGIQHFL